MTLTSAIRKGLKRFPDRNSADEVVNSIKREARNTNISPVSSLFDNLEYTVQNTRLCGNNIPLAKLETLLRRGELIRFGREIGSAVQINPSHQTGFIRTLKNVPDVKLKELDDLIASKRTSNSELDIPNQANGKALYDEMTQRGRTRFESIGQKIKAATITTGVAYGIFVAIKLTNDFYQDIVDATNNAKGCFLVREVNNELIACKLLNRSCTPTSGDTENTCGTLNLPNLPTELNTKYNTTLFLFNIVDTSLASTVGNLLNPQITITNANIPAILANAENFDIVRKYYTENPDAISITNVCTTTVLGVENNSVPPCRACSSSADLNRTEFFDNSDLADNYSLVCVTRGSILDTLVDLGKGLGLDLFSPFGAISGSISGNIFTISIVFLIIFILLVFLSIFIKLRKKKSIN